MSYSPVCFIQVNPIRQYLLWHGKHLKHSLGHKCSNCLSILQIVHKSLWVSVLVSLVLGVAWSSSALNILLEKWSLTTSAFSPSTSTSSSLSSLSPLFNTVAVLGISGVELDWAAWSWSGGVTAFLFLLAPRVIILEFRCAGVEAVGCSSVVTGVPGAARGKIGAGGVVIVAHGGGGWEKSITNT